MKRRHFLALIGGGAAWPIAARSQATAVPVIGLLRSSSFDGVSHLVDAFRNGLKDTGYVEPENIRIEARSAENQLDRLPALVAELLRQRAAIIVANGIAALPAKVITTTVPIIFTTGSDPVRDGLVDSLNRPGGNVTGIIFVTGDLGPKRLELLRQLVPEARRIAILMNPNSFEFREERSDLEKVAQEVGQELFISEVSNSSGIETAFATFVQRRVDSLLVGSGSFMFSNRQHVVALAAHHRIPAVYSQRDAVAAGGLVSYGASNREAYREAGYYAGRILKGEKPGELPVARIATFELAINLSTAKSLGLTMPAALLARADEVIE